MPPMETRATDLGSGVAEKTPALAEAAAGVGLGAGEPTQTLTSAAGDTDLPTEPEARAAALAMMDDAERETALRASWDYQGKVEKLGIAPDKLQQRVKSLQKELNQSLKAQLAQKHDATVALETLKRVHEEERAAADKEQALLVAELKQQHDEQLALEREEWQAKLSAALAETEQAQEGQTAFRTRLLSRRAPRQLQEELGEPITAEKPAAQEEADIVASGEGSSKGEAPKEPNKEGSPTLQRLLARVDGLHGLLMVDASLSAHRRALNEEEIQGVEAAAREYWDQKARKPASDMDFNARLEDAHLRATRLQRITEALAATAAGAPVSLGAAP